MQQGSHLIFESNIRFENIDICASRIFIIPSIVMKPCEKCYVMLQLPFFLPRSSHKCYMHQRYF